MNWTSTAGGTYLDPSLYSSRAARSNSIARGGAISFFLGSDLEPRAELIAQLSAHIRNYVRGEIIYRQGEFGSDFYQLVSGRVRIYIATAHGTERVLSYAEPGATFGESACFDENSYYATALAVMPSRVRVISREAFLRAARRQPQILHEIFRALVRKQRILAQHIATEGICARDRATVLINDMVDAYGDKIPGSAGIRLHLGSSIEDLASMVGLTRVTMSRELSDMVRSGILAKDGLDIIVLEPSALAAAASRVNV